MKYDKTKTFWLIVANGSIFAFGSAFMDPDIIMPGFVHRLTGSAIAVGVVSGIVKAGWLWPQMVVSTFIEHLPRKKPWYTVPAFVRVTSVLLIAVVLVLSNDLRARSLFPLFLFLIACDASFSGIAGVPFMDIVAKTVDNGRYGILFGIRQFIGGILACMAGFVVRSILSERGWLHFPQNYALLFLMSAVLSAVSFGFFILVKEPVETELGKRYPFSKHMMQAPALLRNDLNYRRLLVVRMLASFAGMAAPFYVPFAVRKLGVGYESSGTFLSIGMAALIVSNLIWTYISYRRPSAILFFIGGIIGLASPLIALTVSVLHGASVFSGNLLTVYCLVFAFTTAANAAFGIAANAYLLELAPKEIRPTYVGFINTLTFPFMFASVLAGLLIRWVSYEFVFVLCLVAGMFLVSESRKILAVPRKL